MVERSDEPPVVALVTYERVPEIGADDRLLAEALAVRGVHAQAAVWSDPAVRWDRYAAVIVRACWDYHLRAAEFFAWTARLDSMGARVLNAPATLRWNADKRYLRDLESRGIPIVPTRWIEPGARESLAEVRRRTGWSELVVKPAISGGAHETWRASPGEGGDEARLATMLERGVVLAQPLMSAVVEEGEWSLVFLDGAFSHAVFKRPRTGDFRVQIEHGGTFAPATPAPRLIDEARAALDAAPSSGESTLYARVDGCISGGRLLLMELELIEPALFLGTAPGSAQQMADAVVARLAADLPSAGNRA